MSLKTYLYIPKHFSKSSLRMKKKRKIQNNDKSHHIVVNIVINKQTKFHIHKSQTKISSTSQLLRANFIKDRRFIDIHELNFGIPEGFCNWHSLFKCCYLIKYFLFQRFNIFSLISLSYLFRKIVETFSVSCMRNSCA